MGRHKGSLNKKTLLLKTGSFIKEESDITIKRGRGRPPGSKNKEIPLIIEPQTTTIKRGRGRPRKGNIQTIEKPGEAIGNKKDIDLEIKKLKRLKLKCKTGSQERIDLYRQIKKLKNKINIIQENITPEKLELIKKIKAKKPPFYKDLNIDLTIFTIEQLRNHYKNLIEKGSRI